jgi:hypothetical protein
LALDQKEKASSGYVRVGGAAHGEQDLGVRIALVEGVDSLLQRRAIVGEL